MNLIQTAAIIDEATAILKADNDRAALMKTCPAAWLDIPAMTKKKVSAIREIDAQFQVLRRQQEERDAGDNV